MQSFGVYFFYKPEQIAKQAVAKDLRCQDTYIKSS